LAEVQDALVAAIALAAGGALAARAAHAALAIAEIERQRMPETLLFLPRFL